MTSTDGRIALYDEIGDKYSRTDHKPDKRHSMLPTMRELLSPLDGQRVLDIGCGRGFFTTEYAKAGARAVGVDISPSQIAHATQHPQVRYATLDAMHCSPRALLRLGASRPMRYTRVSTPFLLNQCRDMDSVEELLTVAQECTRTGAKIAGIIDLPQSTLHDNTKYGSLKRMSQLVEGERIDVGLYLHNEPLCALQGWYHAPENIERSLERCGFSDVRWRGCRREWLKPLVSIEGLKEHGGAFWDEYLRRCDVAYFAAQRR